ncbi:MAG TPA: hypothetical protein ENO21_01365 [Firmicutes bacterium]|nr:hypothetical protein [Bacillota bacterium]
MRLPLTLALLLAACLASGAAADDPMVQLDEAKLKLADGKLAVAREMMAEIRTAGAEDYVAEEVLYHQLVLAAAYLSATHYLLQELEQQDYSDTAYYKWLARERGNYVREFEHHASEYLDSTADGSHLPFVRFRLPVVTDEYLQDTGLYSDAQVLGAAVSNWEDGREGLGKGIIGSQVRVAFVLAVAIHYDLPQASTTLEQVAQRLRGGVPISQLVVLDWLSGTIHELTDEADGLRKLADIADQRVIEATSGDFDSHLYRQALARQNAEEDDASD